MDDKIEVKGYQPDRKKLVQEAERLQDIGLNVIPLRPGKIPFLKEGEQKNEPDGFFHRKSTPEDRKEWIRRSKESSARGSYWKWENLGFVTGHTSGVFTVDVDDDDAWGYLEMLGVTRDTVRATPSWSTGRGTQIAFRTPEGVRIPTMTKFLPNVDIKGDKGISVIPPSIHGTGKEYSYITSPHETPFMEAPEELISAIRLAHGDGIDPEAAGKVPQKVIDLIRERVKKTTKNHRGTSRSKKVHVPRDSFLEEIPVGHRNEVLFKKKACLYRYQGYDEKDMFKKLMVDNQIYCDEPLGEDEIREICEKVCINYPKGDLPPGEVLRAYVGVYNYYRENPSKGMSENTDEDMVKALVEEALLHSTIVDEGIEVSISHRQAGDKAGCSKRTATTSIARLTGQRKIAKGKAVTRGNSGSLIIRKDFYEVYAGLHHPTHNNNEGLSGVDSHKQPTSHIRNRWGPGKIGKAKKHLLERIEEVLGEFSEDEVFSPAELVGSINQRIADPANRICTTSISRHLADLCREEVGVLEKIGWGKYRRIGDRYKNLGQYMRDSGEFRSIYNQRKANKKQQEAYRDHLKQVKQTKDKYSETNKVVDQHMYNPPGYCSSGDDVDITTKEEG